MSVSSSSSLLTQSERHAFNTFLNTMSGPDTDVASLPPAGDASAEWQMYSQLGLPVPDSDGSDPLSKATKDLIALHPPPKTSAQQQQQPQQPQQHHRPIAPAPGPSTPYLLPNAVRSSSSRYQYLASHVVRPNPSKRARTSHSDSEPSRVSASPPPLPAKTSLLSPQQKKANHIQSEQKRRANIRRGYEVLCETVPALQEAIRADEEGSGSCSAGNGGGGGGGGGGRRKRTKGEDGEKVDGRAGPRSESVVLQKSTDSFLVLYRHCPGPHHSWVIYSD